MDVPCHRCGELYHCDNHKYQGLCENCTKIEIFRLHYDKMPIYKIAKHVGMSAPLVSQIIYGATTIPKSIVKDIENLGFTICTCCGIRIVPIEKLHNTTLTRLCRVCWRESVPEIYNVLGIKIDDR